MSSEPMILAVDDEAGILRLIKLELSAQGFRVITASNGEEALRIAEEQRPDVVLLDILMPEITGLEVMRRLRERSNTPVILVTAKDKDAAAEWILFLAQPENQAFYCSVLGFVPPRASARKIWGENIDELTRTYAAEQEWAGANQDSLFYYNPVSVALRPTMAAIYLGQMGLEEGVEKMAADVTKLVVDGGGKG